MFRFDVDPQVSFYDFAALWDQLVPADSVFRLFRELAPLLIQPEDFTGLYCLDNGRPSHAARQMTMACMLQEMLGETDRGMEAQTRVNIEVKFALGMALDEPGIDHANFGVHRQRIIQKELDKVYLDRFIRLMYYLGVLTGKEPWITDTTHVIAPISAPTTIELIRQAMRLLVRLLAKQYSVPWHAIPHAPRAVRYLETVTEVKEHNLDDKAKMERLVEVVSEADELLAYVESSEASWKKKPDVIHYALLLCRILRERIIRKDDGTLEIAPGGSVKDMIVSAVDSEARFGCKGKTKWRGYKMAIVEVGNSGFIAAAEAMKANDYDGSSLVPLADQLPTDCVENPTIIGDTHYGAGDDRVTLKEKGIDVVAPLSPKTKCDILAGEGFQVSEDQTQLICPRGKVITTYSEVADGKNFVLRAKDHDCKHCPRYTTCFKEKKHRRTIFIHNAYGVMLEAAKHSQTKIYKEQMRLRSRIEAKQNELVNRYGLRRVRRIGKRNLAYAARLSALAANFQKLNRLRNDKNATMVLEVSALRGVAFKKAA
ncbi:transposase, is4 family [Heliomicrobium modesticaldum Ice1]|uniref:Transposase, is4 family n=1 Tax=Heliobacterium modesticaldum (strain ATCC 51547 / Ice1) TaxID=498761 RepID=B0TDQ9_HELMI|nr:IS1182-like element ISHmo2 family transposase [Heliomicrobium modesticaldum]ABZ82772.1 transposase, is4 family [Heliomicrobium modesticaldum Ice1]